MSITKICNSCNISIIKEQILNHTKNLLTYNIKHNLDLPQEYNNLFAKYLDAGNPLEPLLPLSIGNF
jgi:hypothetical protein